MPSHAPGDHPRDRLAHYALERIPKLLTLLDRNPHSPTHGCFDRAYWHLRIKDFPSGMSQEFVWPLALVWSLELPDNPYREDPAVRDWIEAGIRFAAATAHTDGSCDDYFPYERAAGASAFSLLACLEAAEIVSLNDAGVDAFFARRAAWLGSHRESGQLSNHEALTVLCLLKTWERTRDESLRTRAEERLNRLLSWQHPEGWFSEYGGCDPGYLTLTVGLVAEIARLQADGRLRERALQAARVAADFVHPDGTCGGEYAARNTHNFCPHGFEVLGCDEPALLAANDLFLAALVAGRTPCYDDDYIIAHHMWSYLLAWRDFAEPRPDPHERPAGRRHYIEAGLLVERRGPFELYCGLRKGGVFKLFCRGEHEESDTQFSLRVARGRRERTAVAHLTGDPSVNIEPDRITVEGSFAWAKQTLMTPTKLVILRFVMLTFGRFFPVLIRRLLQSMLITGAAPAPFRYRRCFALSEEGIEVTDEVNANDGWTAVRAIGLGPAQTSIYVVMSRVYQTSQHQPWRDDTDALARLPADGAFTLKRRFEA